MAQQDESIRSDGQTNLGSGTALDVEAESAVSGRLVRNLAGRPGLVVIVTAAMALAATVAAYLASPSLGLVGAVLAFVSLWALFLAIVIYLLTAHDNDKVMDRISALQEQLGAALAAPGPQAKVVEPIEPPDEQHELDEPDEQHEPDAGHVAAVDATQAAKDERLRQRQDALVRRGGQAGGPRGYGWGMPDSYVAAWRQASGRDSDQIARTWTPDPRGRGPWVIEGDDGFRWSVMRSKRSGQTIVVPLGAGRHPNAAGENRRRDQRTDTRVDERQRQAQGGKARRRAQGQGGDDRRGRERAGSREQRD